MSQRLHATDSKRRLTSVKTQDWLKKIGAGFFKPITNRISAKLTVFNQEKASSAAPSEHFVMHFFYYFVVSQLDSFLCDVLEGSFSRSPWFLLVFKASLFLLVLAPALELFQE